VSRDISWTIVCWTYISLIKDCVEGRRIGGQDARCVISGGSGVCGISSTSWEKCEKILGRYSVARGRRAEIEAQMRAVPTSITDQLRGFDVWSISDC
jgi:hypothetical protein